MSDGVKIKILVQVEDNKPRCIGEARLDPMNLQGDLEEVFVDLVKFVRTHPLPSRLVADVMD